MTTDRDMTEVRENRAGREQRPVQAVDPAEFEAYQAFTDLVVHARDYAESTARRRLGYCEQLLVVVDQLWTMLPKYEDNPAGRPPEMSARIAQLRSHVNTEHALNGRRRA